MRYKEEKDKFINKIEQIDQWSKLYGRLITEEEYSEIRDNLSGFFKVLQEWDIEEKGKSNGKL
ncbi:hypothetical protein ACFL2J_00110 [Candidatus Omnitrophota bacterium]